MVIGMIIIMIFSFICGYYFYESIKPYDCDQKAYNDFKNEYYKQSFNYSIMKIYDLK